jgi:trk system potassium uptake protein TrkA
MASKSKNRRLEESLETQKNPLKKLRGLQNGRQFVVIGCGRFGKSVALQLMEMGADVLIIDEKEEIVQQLSTKVTLSVQADATDEEVLSTLGLRNFDTAIVAIGNNMQASILVTLLLKEMGIRLIVAKASNEHHSRVLYKIGANQVVFPDKETGTKLAQNLLSSNVLEFLELTPEYVIVEILPLKEWYNHDLIELNLRACYGLNIIAINRNGNINIVLSPSEIIKEEDRLIVIGHHKQILQFEKSTL